MHGAFFVEPLGELGLRVFDAEVVGGAAAGVDAGGDQRPLVLHLAGAVLGQHGAPHDPGAVGRQWLAGELLQQAQDQLVAAAVGGRTNQALAVVNAISEGRSKDMPISHRGEQSAR